MLLLGTTVLVAPHVIFNAQGLSENMDILSAAIWGQPRGENAPQGKHKVPH